MEIQLIAVFVILAASLFLVVRAIARKVSSFSAAPECDSGCGCNGGKEKLTSSKV